MRPDGLLAADRVAGGPWRSRRLATWISGPIEGEPPISGVHAVLAPDGRAAVAWRDRRVVVAAAGRAGGDWGRPTAQSAITRLPGPPALGLTTAGDPRLVWVEAAVHARLRVRGAQLGPAGVPDAVAPALTASLPSRTPRTKTGAVVLRVPVTCSEACDARVRLSARGIELASAVRELAASRPATLALKTAGFEALRLLADRRLRQPRLQVLVTDRAGNVARRSGTVAFRIVDVPMIELQVAPDHDFAMNSKAGNRAVARLVNDLIAGLAHGTIRSQRELRGRFVKGRAALRSRYGEIVDDTDPGDAIFEALYVPCKRRGYDPEVVAAY